MEKGSEGRMKKEKIHYLRLPMRCIQKELEYRNKKFKFFIIKDSPARSTPYGIVINDYFFNINEEGQFATLCHEEYHGKVLTRIKRLFNLFRFFSIVKTKHEEEYKADNYAAKKAGKEGVLLFLEDGKKSYENGNVKYNPKTHPAIDERIKRIKEL